MIRSSVQAAKIASRVAPRNAGTMRFMSAKDIKFGVEGRAAMLRGVEILADAVQVRTTWQAIFLRIFINFSVKTRIFNRSSLVCIS